MSIIDHLNKAEAERDEALERLRKIEPVVDLAQRIANDAPGRQGQYVHRAGVRWSLIHELRATLKELS